MTVIFPFQREDLENIYSPTNSMNLPDLDESNGSITTSSVTNKMLKQTIKDLSRVTPTNLV